MASAFSTSSTFGRPSSARTRPTTRDGEKPQIWVPMLNSASKGKDLPEKHLIVLGGTPEQQKEFLEQLNPENPRPRYGDRRNQRRAPLSNKYTLGYTYHDVLDADQEDTLARINVHLLSSPSATFAPLLTPLLTPTTVKDTLIAILLDWSEPLKWARQLRQWIRLLRSVILSLDDETKIAMEESMTAWKGKRRGPESQPLGTDPKAIPPLGPGEWDEGLGIPLSLICIQSEKVYSLDREVGWNDDHFDFLMQWARCVALKHGASLVYTSTSDPNSVRPLIHSTLSIQSLLKKEIIKPNYIDKDKILIPPNWDSWGKIRPLREGTDLEIISEAWAAEIQDSPEDDPDFTTPPQPTLDDDSAVSIYESFLPPPRSVPSYNTNTTNENITVPSVQEFLQSQYSILQSLQSQDDKETRKPTKPSSSRSTGTSTPVDSTSNANARMAEHIGPYQINVNGIDFDAEEATRILRLKEYERELEQNNKPKFKPGESTPTKKGAVDESKTSNEAMSQFFANLIKKDKKGVGSPGRGGGSPAPERSRD